MLERAVPLSRSEYTGGVGARPNLPEFNVPYKELPIPGIILIKPAELEVGDPTDVFLSYSQYSCSDFAFRDKKGKNMLFFMPSEER